MMLHYVRQVGEAQISCEIGMDEDHEGSEAIFRTIAEIDAAVDRMKAKADLASHYARLLNIFGQIEMSRKALETDTVRFETENATRYEGRRMPGGLTDQQMTAIEQHRVAIREGHARIADVQAAIVEARRVLEGEDLFAVMSQKVTEGLEKLMVRRPAAA
jgi:multidrug resistance efflux pump